MRKVFSKIILWLISLNILLSIAPLANAEKYSIDKHDRYLDSEIGFFDGDGNKIYLDQYEGTNILLVFWARTASRITLPNERTVFQAWISILKVGPTIKTHRPCVPVQSNLVHTQQHPCLRIEKYQLQFRTEPVRLRWHQ